MKCLEHVVLFGHPLTELDREKHVGKAQGELDQNSTSGSMLLIKKPVAITIRRDTELKTGEQIRRELQFLYIRQASRPLRNSRSCWKENRCWQKSQNENDKC